MFRPKSKATLTTPDCSIVLSWLRRRLAVRTRILYDRHVYFTDIINLWSVAVTTSKVLLYSHFPFLWGLPFYYASQAPNISKDAENIYQRFLPSLPQAELEFGPPTSATPRLQAPTLLGRVPGRLSPDLPERLVKIERAWGDYIDSRVAEWKVFLVFNGILVT